MGVLGIYDLQGLSYGRTELLVADMRLLAPDAPVALTPPAVRVVVIAPTAPPLFAHAVHVRRPGRRGSLRGARAGIVGGRAQLVLPPPSGGRPRPEELREKIKSSKTYCGAHRGSGPGASPMLSGEGKYSVALSLIHI